jgi:hypothetical protein
LPRPLGFAPAIGTLAMLFVQFRDLSARVNPPAGR